jgi:hypothetical protein
LGGGGVVGFLKESSELNRGVRKQDRKIKEEIRIRNSSKAYYRKCKIISYAWVYICKLLRLLRFNAFVLVLHCPGNNSYIFVTLSNGVMLSIMATL